jgi:rod shape-determining protein MreD
LLKLLRIGTSWNMSSFLNKQKWLNFFPFISTLVMVIIFLADSNGLFITGFYPSVVSICIFYWVLFARNLMTGLSIFVIGVIFDFLYSNPVGLSSLSLLAAYSLIKDQQDDILKYGFTFIWLAFCAFNFVYFTVNWFLSGLYLTDFSFQWETMFRFISTVLFFPLFYKLFSFMKRKKKRFGYS